MRLFHAPDIAETGLLPQSEAHHAFHVLRMQPGDEITVVDGRGNAVECRLVAMPPKRGDTPVEVLRVTPMPPAWSQRLTLAVAPTKNTERMDWLTEKLTEVGVNRIVPLRCERSERRDLRRDRLEKVAVSAMKQSLKAKLPEIDTLTSFADFISEVKDSDADLFVAHCDATTERIPLARAYTPGRDAVLLIGPEGDFSPTEITAALKTGFRPVTLGDNRLRTETAALMGIHTFHVINQLHNQ